MMSQLKVKLVNPNAQVPKRGDDDPSNAGLDLYSVEEETIQPLTRVKIDTGVQMAIPQGYYGRVAPRSGLAVKHGIDVLAGVVDSSYRGSIQVILYNTDKDTPYTVKLGERIAQLIITPYACPDVIQVDTLEETKRGDGGFGSTGR